MMGENCIFFSSKEGAKNKILRDWFDHLDRIGTAGLPLPASLAESGTL